VPSFVVLITVLALRSVKDVLDDRGDFRKAYNAYQNKKQALKRLEQQISDLDKLVVGLADAGSTRGVLTRIGQS